MRTVVRRRSVARLAERWGAGAGRGGGGKAGGRGGRGRVGGVGAGVGLAGRRIWEGGVPEPWERWDCVRRVANVSE